MGGPDPHGLRPRVPEHVVSADMGGTRVVLDTRTWQLLRLRVDVAQLWPLLDGSTPLSELEAALTTATGETDHAATRWLREGLDALAAEGLLEWV